MFELIANYNDIVENVKTFNECIRNSNLLIDRLSQFRHWYYIVELEMFAPSKFIGYKGNNSEEYRIGTSPVNGYMDGRNTERVLSQLFNGLQAEGHEIHHKELVDFLYSFGKSPNQNVQIYVIEI